jgi:hypothetical protein
MIPASCLELTFSCSLDDKVLAHETIVDRNCARRSCSASRTWHWERPPVVPPTQTSSWLLLVARPSFRRRSISQRPCHADSSSLCRCCAWARAVSGGGGPDTDTRGLVDAAPGGSSGCFRPLSPLAASKSFYTASRCISAPSACPLSNPSVLSSCSLPRRRAADLGPSSRELSIRDRPPPRAGAGASSRPDCGRARPPPEGALPQVGRG